jgi:hypothetical protein
MVLANATESLNMALELLESGSVHDYANALDRGHHRLYCIYRTR